MNSDGKLMKRMIKRKTLRKIMKHKGKTMENNVEDIMKFCTNNDKDEQRPKSINFKPWNRLFYMIVEFYNKSQNPGWEH